MAYATVTDLESLWRPLTDLEQERAGVLLDAAAVWLDALRLPSTPATGRELDARRVVSCAMVRRSMQAPVDQAPATAATNTAGPFSHQVTYANPTGDLYVTKAEKRLLGVRQQAATVWMGPA